MLKKHHVTLTLEERPNLEAMTRRGRTAASTLVRALVLLKCDERDAGQPCPTRGRPSPRVRHSDGGPRAAAVRRGRPDAALRPKPSTRVYARRLEGDNEARLVTLACSTPPKGRDRWTLRLLTDRIVVLGQAERTLSYQTVRRVLKK